MKSALAILALTAIVIFIVWINHRKKGE